MATSSTAGVGKDGKPPFPNDDSDEDESELLSPEPVMYFPGPELELPSPTPSSDNDLANVANHSPRRGSPAEQVRSNSSFESPNESDIEEIEEIIRNMNQTRNKLDWTTFGIRGGVAVIMFPSQMSQILMQLGYEPFPPSCSVTLLGRPCLLLPSTATYLKYIYHVDGIRGLFRGLCPRLAQQLLHTYVFDIGKTYFRRRRVNNLVYRARAREENLEVDVAIIGNRNNDDSENSDLGIDSVGFIDHFREVVHELISKITAVVISYPVHVVAVRTIAHFVGREHCMGACSRGIFSEIAAIYHEFGILGFYRGLVPKIVGESCQTLMVGALAYFVSNNAPGIEIRSLLNLSFSVLVSAWTYQFTVVSTTMAVNGSSLMVGGPPLNPIYDSWLECWHDLKKARLLNRGSSIICRYYLGPTILVNGIKAPCPKMYFGPNHLPIRLLSPVPPGAIHKSNLVGFTKLAINTMFNASLPLYYDSNSDDLATKGEN